ncbi:MAG: M15 family metallopeptidase [Clostridiales bacterium]|nr:M15 family metallopeptidase [Clostridiales bacterium]
MKHRACLMLIFLLMLTLLESASAEVIESYAILVNKTSALPSDYEPSDLTRPDVKYAPGVAESRKQMRPAAARALEELFKAAADDGIELLAISGYRSYWTQNDLYNRRLKETSLEYVSVYVAKPGQSEHQTGLAMDLGCTGYTDLTERFAETPAYAWLSEHAHEYGFIIRYPKDGTAETGYAYEPWHIRYLGDLAEDVYESGLTLEAWYARRLGGSRQLQSYEFPVTELALKGLG